MLVLQCVGALFEQYYRSGRWDYLDNEHSAEMVTVVEKYANKGRILDMGCGPGVLVSLLNPDSFEYYRGVDASSEAVALAQKRASEKVGFQIGDIQSYGCEDDFDCIVFEESLYYVPSACGMGMPPGSGHAGKTALLAFVSFDRREIAWGSK